MLRFFQILDCFLVLQISLLTLLFLRLDKFVASSDANTDTGYFRCRPCDVPLDACNQFLQVFLLILATPTVLLDLYPDFNEHLHERLEFLLPF